MSWTIPLSQKQLDYVRELIEDAQDIECEEQEDELNEWPYVNDDALIIPDEDGVYVLREDLLRAIDEWEKGRRKKMVENILDHIDVAIGREDAIPAGQSVRFTEARGGRSRSYTIVGPWPKRWPH